VLVMPASAAVPAQDAEDFGRGFYGTTRGT
jgi:hypothetical protein